MKRMLALAVLIVLLVSILGGREAHGEIIPLTPTGKTESGTAQTGEKKPARAVRIERVPAPYPTEARQISATEGAEPQKEEPFETASAEETEPNSGVRTLGVFSPNAYVGSWSMDPESGREEYYIKVNIRANTVTVYGRGESGEFDRPLRAMICSTGSATPKQGVYCPGWRLEWQNLFYGVYGQFVIQITGNILFHSVPYQEKFNKSSLEYWEYDKLGTTASAGCVRLQVKDAKWLYDRHAGIVAVEFYGDDEPGPLGKPKVQTISGDALRRGWDPTDPDEDNFWLLSDEEIYVRCPWLEAEEPPKPTPAPLPKCLPETQ